MADLREQLQSGLDDRYRLERELGRGGMATVFLAHDLRHKRPVALKVLHPELAHTLGPERFQREIETVARLQHPNILTVHDSGATGGQLWFTMPFVEGESLRDRLRREQQLPVEVALRIATDAARALQYAHDHGVIHRDIKPENLLLTNDGSTLVADFGIARALSGSDDRLTETGMSVGTPTYMSPEQSAGDRHLDARTDVYSLGTVLYEMLAGEPPFTGATAQTVIAKRLSGQVPRLRHVRPSVPEHVEQAVSQALAPVAADRFASAAEFARALQPGTAIPTSRPARRSSPPASRSPRRLPLAALTLGLGFLIGLGVLFAWRRSHPRAENAGDATVLAVLPFENLGDSGQAYFADGVANELRTKLSTVPGLAVIARSSSNEYRKSQKPAQQIARELGVDYLLTATVQWENGPGGTSRVRVTPELVDVRPGHTPQSRWGQPFEAGMTGMFQVQADIAGQVAQALDIALGVSERRALTERPTRNLAAYDAFLQGEQISQNLGASDVPTLQRAAAYYERAVALDSAFAPAWAQLSRALSLVYANGNVSPAVAARARAAAERALNAAPGEPEGHLALGDYFSNVRPEFDRALRAYEAGLRLSPSHAELLGASALAEVSADRWETALAHFTRAQALDPRSVATSRRLAYTLLRLRRYSEARAVCDRGLALDSANLDLLETKVMVFLAQGSLEKARQVVRAAPQQLDSTTLVATFATYWDLYWVLEPEQQALLLRLPPSAFADRSAWAIVRAQTYALQRDRAGTRAYADLARIGFGERLKGAPDDAQSHVFLGLALAYLGRKVEAVREGELGVTLVPVARDAYTGAYLQHLLTRIYLLVGEPEKALDQLEPLLKIPYYLSPGWLKIDPNFAPLRGNPRFERLLRGT